MPRVKVWSKNKKVFFWCCLIKLFCAVLERIPDGRVRDVEPLHLRAHLPLRPQPQDLGKRRHAFNRFVLYSVDHLNLKEHMFAFFKQEIYRTIDEKFMKMINSNCQIRTRFSQDGSSSRVQMKLISLKLRRRRIFIKYALFP